MRVSTGRDWMGMVYGLRRLRRWEGELAKEEGSVAHLVHRSWFARSGRRTYTISFKAVDEQSRSGVECPREKGVLAEGIGRQ